MSFIKAAGSLAEFSLQLRKLHKWMALVSALPLLLMLITGVLLSISPQVGFLQPKNAAASGSGLSIPFEKILIAARSVPEAQIVEWSDIAQIDSRPSAGLVRVRAKNYFEIQIDGHTGAVLNSAPRWKTLLITLHDGAWFGNGIRYGIFVPTAFVTLALWLTGLLIWWIPILQRRKRHGT